jgi:heavy metal sensor kinase
LAKSTNAPISLTLPNISQRDSSIHSRMLSDQREVLQFTEMGDCVLVGRYIGADLAAMRWFAWWLFAAGAGILVIALAGAWWLASGAIRPIEHISSAASRISAGNLAERINVTETDSELGRLAGVLNNTFTRLEAAFAQQKQFTADASHELRTPITVLISEAQTALSRERSAAEYRESLQTCLATAQQMRTLAQSLLELARYDAGQERIKHEPVDLAERARACAELVRPLARERGIEIRCDLTPAITSGDPVRLGQVITNLLTNAVHYNFDRGVIQLVTRDEGSNALLSVADSGAGISSKDLPQVFERFYRSDKARTSSTGRTGLGLAICKAIVDSHGGSIAVDSRPGEGATFQVRLPKGAKG